MSINQPSVAVPPSRPEEERDWSRTLFTWAVWGGLILSLVWSWTPAEMGRWTYLFTDGGNMAEYASAFLSPSFRDFDYYLEEMVLTVQIAIWGTVLAVIAAVPFAILSSNNIVPWWVYQPSAG
jgi:phosphonate transport system permease protein